MDTREMLRASARVCWSFGILFALGACGDDAAPSTTAKDAGKHHPAKDAGAKDAGAKDAGNPDSGSGSTHASGGTGKWLMMGYDQKNNYFNPTEHTLSVDNAPDLKELWRFEVGGFPPGSPVIADGLVFVMATGGTYALYLDDGTQAWMHDDMAGTASVAYADGFIYVHATNGAKLYKLDAKTGDVMWGPISTYPEDKSCDGTSSPILAKGLVLVGHSCGAAEVSPGADQVAARGGVEAFNIDDGSQAWRYWTVPETGENGATVWSSVSVDIDGDTVFAATGNNYTMAGEDSDSIHAISLSDGTRKWKQQVRTGDLWSPTGGGGVDTDFGANPILAEIDGKKIVADGDKGSAFWALDRDTGTILWSRTDLSASHDPAHGGMLMNGAFDGKYFYVASNEMVGASSQLHALDPNKDGADVWDPVKLDNAVWGALSLANGLLIVPVGSVLTVFEAATGKKLTEFETGGTIAAGAAAIVNGRIVVKSGLSYVFDRNTVNNNLVICYGL